MDFGMPTLIEIPSLADTVALCEELGLTFIELNMNMPQYQLGMLSADILRGYQHKSLYFTIHLDENFNVWDFNPLVSQAYIDTALAAIELAIKAHIPIVNMHMHKGIYLTMPDQKIALFEYYRDEYRRKTAQFRQACEKAIGKNDLLICVENCDGFTGFQLEAIEYLLQSPAFGLTLDIGHNHSAGYKDEAFILAHQNKLCHMHIHDALSTRNHLAVGTGEIDIQKKLMLAHQHDCRCVLETKTVEGLKASVAYLRHHFASYAI